MNNINAVDCTTKYRGIWFSLNGDTLDHEKRWKVLLLRFQLGRRKARYLAARFLTPPV